MSTLSNLLIKTPNMVQSARGISWSRSTYMPYKPEERLPLTDHQKKLYPQVEQEFTDEGYPLLNFRSRNRNAFAPRTIRKHRNAGWSANLQPREKSMPENQDWPSVWPTARTFSPSAVPLPIRQSFEQKPHKPPIAKHCNFELLKIPNFLHLSPLAIERQCTAIKKFCTKWPEELRDDSEIEKHFPVTYIQCNYVHSSPSIRDPRARVVQLKVNIDHLNLNETDKDKLIRLAAHRFDSKTRVMTITADACPSRIQNKDYCDYLLTALYFESMRHEPWEQNKPECDWERFFWEKSESKEKAKQYLNQTANKPVPDEVFDKGQGNEIVEGYRESLENVFLNESVDTLEQYRQSVEKLYGIDSNKASL